MTGSRIETGGVMLDTAGAWLDGRFAGTGTGSRCWDAESAGGTERLGLGTVMKWDGRVQLRLKLGA